MLAILLQSLSETLPFDTHLLYIPFWTHNAEGHGYGFRNLSYERRARIDFYGTILFIYQTP